MEKIRGTINGVPDLRHCNWCNFNTDNAYHSGILTERDAREFGMEYGNIPDEDLYLHCCAMAMELRYLERTGISVKDIRGICFSDIFIALIDPTEAEGWEE